MQLKLGTKVGGKVWRREKEEWGAQKVGDWEPFGGTFLHEAPHSSSLLHSCLEGSPFLFLCSFKIYAKLLTSELLAQT